MGYSFLEFMKKIGIFIICAHSFLQFSAGKSYEKYLKFLIGLMVLAQFAIPFGGMVLGKDAGKIWEEAERFRMELEERAGEVVWELEEEDIASQALEEEILSKLEPAAEGYGYRVREVTVHSSPSRIEVVVYKGKKEKGRIEVETIRIGGGMRNGKEREEATGQYSSMRQSFSAALGTEEAYIVIREE